jgi:hypothetical protein
MFRGTKSKIVNFDRELETTRKTSNFFKEPNQTVRTKTDSIRNLKLKR